MTGQTPALCRDCLARFDGDAQARCPGCGSRRAVRHAELDALTIAHLDCDAFFAAIEKRDDPALRDKPVIVGGGKRGVVATCCYVARAYGVRSAMPMFKALAACPEAVVIKPRMAIYVAESRRVRTLMGALTPLVEPLSIDEAFLDLAGTRRLHKAAPAEVLANLQNRVETEVGITVSIGLSHNKFLAKIASDLDKPRGFSVIGRAETPAFLARQPVSIVFGVGPAFARTLARDGLKTLADVTARDESDLMKRYGEAGRRLHALARGCDDRAVEPGGERRSLSSETTFEQDINDLKTLEKALWRLSVRVADRCKAAGVAGRVVTLKLKRADFAVRTRRTTLARPIQLADALFRCAQLLLQTEADGTAFRLLGVGLSSLSPAQGDEGDLLDPTALKRAAAERAGDVLRARFGDDAVVKGRGLETE